MCYEMYLIFFPGFFFSYIEKKQSRSSFGLKMACPISHVECRILLQNNIFPDIDAYFVMRTFYLLLANDSNHKVASTNYED